MLPPSTFSVLQVHISFWPKNTLKFFENEKTKNVSNLHANNTPCFLQLRVWFSFIHSFIHSFVRSFVRSFIHSTQTWYMVQSSKRILSKPPEPHAIYDVQAWKPAHAPFKKKRSPQGYIIHRASCLEAIYKRRRSQETHTVLPGGRS